ncbi:unnamed protein product [Closterium sp. NIES-53]
MGQLWLRRTCCGNRNQFSLSRSFILFLVVSILAAVVIADKPSNISSFAVSANYLPDSKSLSAFRTVADVEDAVDGEPATVSPAGDDSCDSDGSTTLESRNATDAAAEGGDTWAVEEAADDAAESRTRPKKRADEKFDYLATVVANATSDGSHTRRKLQKRCNLGKGAWVYVDSYRPIYNGNSCKFIRSGFNCERNGRTDSNYLRYRWKPRNCNLPTFDIGTFLPMMRNKVIAFIGDSIARNFQQSVACQVGARELVQEWSGTINGQAVSGLSIPNYNIKLLAIISPFLARYSNSPSDFTKYGLKPPQQKEIEGGNGGAQGYVVWTDQLDPLWTAVMPSVDVAVFMSGHWFLSSQGRTDVRSLAYVRGRTVTPTTGFAAYTTTLKRVVQYLDNEIKYKGLALWLSYTPSHYSSSNPPSCDFNAPYPPTMPITDKSAVSFNDIEKRAARASKSVKHMDLTAMMALRPDGHVQKYYGPAKNSKTKWDCLHWCLPGVPDAWTDVLQQMLIYRGLSPQSPA